MPDAFTIPLPGRAMTDSQASAATAWWAAVTSMVDRPAFRLLRQQCVETEAKDKYRMLGANDEESALALRTQATGVMTLDRLLRHWGETANEAANSERPKMAPPTWQPQDATEARQWIERAQAARELAGDPAWPILCVWLAALAYAQADAARTMALDAVPIHNAMRREIEALCLKVDEWIALGLEAGRWIEERGKE